MENHLYGSCSDVFEAKRTQHAHYRLPPTELANIWLGARLT